MHVAVEPVQAAQKIMNLCIAKVRTPREPSTDAITV
jgi:hypothetical protein